MYRFNVVIVSAVTLFLFTMVGGPGGAYAQTCPANVPHVDGVWRTLPYLMPINPISATLLWNGHVLIVSGSEYDADNAEYGGYRAAEWNPAGADESSITVQNLSFDVFCSGTAVLPDGRPLIVGGYRAALTRPSIFNPVTNLFPETESTANGRWYATATALGNGHVATFSGRGVNGGINSTIEIYDLANAGVGWSSPTTAPFTPPLYPRMELLPNGTVFFTGQGAILQSTNTTNSWVFDPSSTSWVQSALTTGNRGYGSAVILPLLPPNYTPRIMNFGGGSPAAKRSTEIIDLSNPSPVWSSGPNMSTARVEMNAVILPSGEVLAEGGSVKDEVADTPGKHADLYDPISNTFSSGGTAAYSRLYHSTALLLPDATVMSLGSNPESGEYEPAIEIYTPAYLYNVNDQLIVNRPAITSASPGVLGYSAPFSINYTASNLISSAVLMRPGSATHAFDMDQRLVSLCGPAPQPACAPGGGTLLLTTPPSGNIAPPGYYMLFLLDSAGVPSIAQFIQLSLHPTAPPSATINSPPSDVTIVARSSVNFGSTSSASQYSWVFPGGTPATSTLQNPGNVIFNIPGTYLTSLTAIDALGNTDPNPPTRKVTVIAPNPDFVIAVSPTATQVFPGQSTTFQVTVTPRLGFNGQVTLGVENPAGFPSGVSSGGFNPPQIVGSGTSILTMNTTTAAVPYAVSLTITGTSGSIEHGGSTTLLINLAPPSNLMASARKTSVSLSWNASVAASGYHVKRANVAGGPYVGIGCAASTSFIDSNVVKGTKYYYVVSADYKGGPDAGGESADSSEASVNVR